MQLSRTVPSQTPPQLELSVEQAVLPPWGAPVVGKQVPSWPLTSQASHWPVQVVSQQTPSTHDPARQLAVDEQVTP